MNEFELLRNVTIGQYIPTGSLVHRLDPRAKLLGGIGLILCLSFTRSFIATLLIVVIVAVVALLSRIPLSYVLRGILLGLPILILVFMLQFLFQGWAEPAGKVYFEWGWLRVTRFSMQLIVVGLTRIIGFIIITSLITMTSTVTHLTHGVESLLKPFRRFGVPSHEIALINMIALRFVPTLAEEMERVMKAQASRCGEFGATRGWRPDKTARAYLPLIVPLFIGALRRAEELVFAMEARCYIAGDERTKFVVLHSTFWDWLIVAVVVAFFFFVWLTHWPPIHQFIPIL
jgi:energy-coupling factor transport system permease protein